MSLETEFFFWGKRENIWCSSKTFIVDSSFQDVAEVKIWGPESDNFYIKKGSSLLFNLYIRVWNHQLPLSWPRKVKKIGLV